MLSKNKIKYIHALEQKKYRKEENAFVAEGFKLTEDLLGIFRCKMLVALPGWLEKHPDIQADEIITATADELTKASLLKTPQEVLAVFEQPHYTFSANIFKRKLSLALDNIQDPGNLGTIVRLADWFGIEHIICSNGTVDIYNPKAIQATMGAISRVKVHYTDLPSFLNQQNEIPIYGTFLNGNDMYQEELTPDGIIVMGNEGNGISEQTAAYINRRLYIPNYPKGRATSESLNVAMATGIICSEFRRRCL